MRQLEISTQVISLSGQYLTKDNLVLPWVQSMSACVVQGPGVYLLKDTIWKFYTLSSAFFFFFECVQHVKKIKSLKLRLKDKPE